MIRNRFLIQAALVTLVGAGWLTTTALAPHAPVGGGGGVSALSLRSSTARSDFTMTLSGPGTTSMNDHVCVGQSLDWSVSISGGTSPFSFNWALGPIGYEVWSGNSSTWHSTSLYSTGWHRVIIEAYDAQGTRRVESAYLHVDNC